MTKITSSVEITLTPSGPTLADMLQTLADKCPVTYGYRLYRGETFCKLEREIYAELDAVIQAREAVKSGSYTHADITRNGVIIGTVNNDLEYGNADNHS